MDEMLGGDFSANQVDSRIDSSDSDRSGRRLVVAGALGLGADVKHRSRRWRTTTALITASVGLERIRPDVATTLVLW